jgi:hypothetical protein
MAAGLLKHAMPDRLSSAVKSVYYRRKVKAVPDDELEKITVLLGNEGLEPATSHIRAPSSQLR